MEYGGKPSALGVIGTHAIQQGIILMAGNQHMSPLRVHQAMNKLPFAKQTAADAGANGQIQTVEQTFGGAQGAFRQRRRVDIGVYSAGNTQSTLQFFQQGITLPGQLGSVEDSAVAV